MTPSATSRRPRLVALDDDPTLAGLVAVIARRAGFEVAVAHSTERFFRALVEPADVVTIDLAVPRTDGLEVMRALAELPWPPEVVLISSPDDRSVVGAGLVAAEFGLRVRGRLRKPFRAGDLQALLGLPGGRAAAASSDGGRRVGHAEASGGDTCTAVLEDAPPATDDAAEPARTVPPVVHRDDLVRALARDELPIAYQPILDVRTGAWVGGEALVRWQHPDHGLLLPDDFLHLVADELLASDLTMAVLRRAARDWVAVRNRIGLPLGLSVNVHPLALGDPGFAALAMDAVQQAAIDPASVTLELTEVAPASRGESLATLARLRRRGFGIALDHFGSGHSSLERLSQVPFTELKVDRTFVGELESNGWARTIVAQAVTLARALGLRAAATGVESETALAWLRSLGCEQAQGEHLGRPVWPGELPAWLERRVHASPLIL